MFPFPGSTPSQTPQTPGGPLAQPQNPKSALLAKILGGKFGKKKPKGKPSAPGSGPGMGAASGF